MSEKTAFTISEFCRRNSVGRTKYYALERAGRGPRVMELGPKMRRVTAEAERDWQRSNERGNREQSR